MVRVLVLLIWMSFSGHCYAATIWCNPANTGAENGLTKETGYNTWDETHAAMSGGDTVMIADGDWSATAKMSIIHPYLPDAGSAEAYTTVQAETDWAVRLPNIYDSGVGRSYIVVRGIVFDGRANATYLTERAHVVLPWHHAKFIRCGFLAGRVVGNNHCCGFGASASGQNHDNLMEECIAWGGGRYVYYEKYGLNNIFRRCVARHDVHLPLGTTDQDAGQIFNFRSYSSSGSVYQNCISIDSDRIQYYNGGALQNEAGGYWVGDQYSTDGNIISGCISLKDVHLPFYLAGAGSGTTVVSNCSVIDTPVAGYTTLSAVVLKSDVNVTVNNMLGIDSPYAGQDGFYGKNAGSLVTKSSILKNINEYCVFSLANSYLNYHTVGAGVPTGTGTTSYDPEQNGLLYPVRIEAGSALATAGEGGGVCGPTILKKIGTSGTLYGETGWNTITDDDLWPYPNEHAIKTLMSTTVAGVSGEYGFCTGTSMDGSAQTLTKYVWEYLGNQIPADIYGSGTPAVQNRVGAGSANRLQSGASITIGAK